MTTTGPVPTVMPNVYRVILVVVVVTSKFRNVVIMVSTVSVIPNVVSLLLTVISVFVTGLVPVSI